MGMRTIALINGIWAPVDSDAPSTALSPGAATDQGGVVVYSCAQYLVNHATVITGITSAGSGVIISTAERNSLHAHANLAILAGITAVGSGIIISASERAAIGTNTALATHVNRAILDGITDVGSGAIITADERALVASLSSGTNYRGGLDGDADITGNATGNAYLDGDTSMSIGDLFVVTGNGTLTTNSGTNIAVVTGDHVYVQNDTTDSTIVDSDLDVVSVGASGVTSIDFGGGPLSGVVSVDSDDVFEGATHLFLTPAERALVATISALTDTVGDNTTLATHGNRTQLDLITDAGSGVIMSTAERTALGNKLDTATFTAHPANSILAAGSGTVISTAERAKLTEMRTPGVGKTNYVWTATGENLDQCAYVALPPIGTGTVSSVNSVAPSGGNVSLTMDNMPETATKKVLTSTERTNIATALANASTNASAIAKIYTQQTLTDAASIVFDGSAGQNAQLTIGGNRTLPLITNATIGKHYQLIVQQDGTGGRTLNVSAYYKPGGIAVLSTAPGARDLVQIYVRSLTEMWLSIVPDWQL